MPISNVIHDRRKELGLTQEQIASYLGVSAPAVNKWEKGSTYPDITLLPPLARLLKVDLNTLLCFQEELSGEEIQNFGNEAITLLMNNGLEEGFRMMNQKIREYPRCTKLIHTFALAADSALIMSELMEEEKRVYEDQILLWYRRVVDSEEEEKKCSAAYMLASKYMQRGKFDRAQEMIDLLPEPDMLDKRTVQADLYLLQKKEEDLPKATELLQRKLLMTVMEVHAILNRLAKIELAAQNERKAKQISEITEKAAKLLELGDYYACIVPLDIALEQKDVQESVKLFDTLLSSVQSLWSMKDSILYDRIGANVNGKESAARILPPLLARLEKAPEYEFLRENKDFKRIIEKYRKKL